MKNAWAGGPEEFEMPQQMQMPQETVEVVEQPLPKGFEAKAKATIEFIGDNWGYGPLLIIIIAGIMGRRWVKSFLFDPKGTIRKMVE